MEEGGSEAVGTCGAKARASLMEVVFRWSESQCKLTVWVCPSPRMQCRQGACGGEEIKLHTLVRHWRADAMTVWEMWEIPDKVGQTFLLWAR